MSNSKTAITQENKKNLEKKLGEILGLERAAQKAVDELISMKLIKSDSQDQAMDIQKEATFHEEQIQEVVLELRCSGNRTNSRGNRAKGYQNNENISRGST